MLATVGAATLATVTVRMAVGVGGSGWLLPRISPPRGMLAWCLKRSSLGRLAVEPRGGAAADGLVAGALVVVVVVGIVAGGEP